MEEVERYGFREMTDEERESAERRFREWQQEQMNANAGCIVNLRVPSE